MRVIRTDRRNKARERALTVQGKITLLLAFLGIDLIIWRDGGGGVR
jgi:hypothetical protein